MQFKSEWECKISTFSTRLQGYRPCDRAVSKASFTAVLTKGCGEENNDEDCSRTDEALSDVSGTEQT